MAVTGRGDFPFCATFHPDPSYAPRNVLEVLCRHSALSASPDTAPAFYRDFFFDAPVAAGFVGVTNGVGSWAGISTGAGIRAWCG